MRQAITTRYFGPTNHSGSRIKALARKRDSIGAEMSLTMPYDYSGNAEQVHAKAAHMLAVKLGWSGLWVAGGAPDNTGNLYVNVCDTYPGAPDSSIGREGADWFYVGPDAKVSK